MSIRKSIQASAKKHTAKMSIGSHLKELKHRFVVIFLVFVAATIGSFALINGLAEGILKLGSEVGYEYVVLTPSEQLTAYLKLAVIAGIVIDSPIILWELWAFIAPALTAREKRSSSLALVGGFFFFALGVVFSYWLILPFSLQFLVNFNTSDMISLSISVESYLNFVIKMLLAFGFVFEMPVLSLLLSYLGLLKPDYMRKVRKFAILVIFVLAAVITPPDVVSQVALAIPMLLLYELSIWISARIAVIKQRRENEDDDDDEEDDDDDDDETPPKAT